MSPSGQCQGDTLALQHLDFGSERSCPWTEPKNERKTLEEYDEGKQQTQGNSLQELQTTCWKQILNPAL